MKKSLDVMKNEEGTWKTTSTKTRNEGKCIRVSGTLEGAINHIAHTK